MVCNCNPYTPSVGVLNNLALGSRPSGGNWRFENSGVIIQGDKFKYILSYNNVPKNEIGIDQDATVVWAFFANNNFLLVNAQKDGNFNLYIYDLRDPTNINLSKSGDLSFSTVRSGASLQSDVSSDGLALFTFISYSGGTEKHTIFRTDNGNVLTAFPGTLYESYTIPRKAEITASTARIYLAMSPEREVSSDLLPRGKLEIINTPVFDEVELSNSQNPQGYSLGVFTLKNNGTDCLCVMDIDPDPPFSVHSISDINNNSLNYPVTLDPEDELLVTVIFSPQHPTSGSPNLTGFLTITCNPANTCNVTIDCEGSARGIANLHIVNNNQTFEAVLGGHPSLSTVTRTYEIQNIGFADFTIENIHQNSPFRCITVPPQQIISAEGDSISVDIIFEPASSVANITKQLTIDPAPPAGDDELTCIGSTIDPRLQVGFNITENFGTIKLEEPGEPQERTNRLTITNNGQADLEILSVQFNNTTATGSVGFFWVTDNFNPPRTLQYNASGISRDIVFRPSSPTHFTTEVIIDYQWHTSPNVTPGTKTINLTGKAMRKIEYPWLSNKWIWVMIAVIVLTLAFIIANSFQRGWQFP